MLNDDVKSEIQKALKARDVVRLETMKMLATALSNAEIAKKREKLTEDEELKVVQSEAKKRKDAIEAYEKGGAFDRAEKEKQELIILEKYLPTQLTDDELGFVIRQEADKLGGLSGCDFGRLMSSVMKQIRGKADGKRVSEMVNQLLAKGQQ